MLSRLQLLKKQANGLSVKKPCKHSSLLFNTLIRQCISVTQVLYSHYRRRSVKVTQHTVLLLSPNNNNVPDKSRLLTMAPFRPIQRPARLFTELLILLENSRLGGPRANSAMVVIFAKATSSSASGGRRANTRRACRHLLCWLYNIKHNTGAFAYLDAIQAWTWLCVVDSCLIYSSRRYMRSLLPIKIKLS